MRTKEEEIQLLADKWNESKQLENKAKESRLEVEGELLELLKNELKDKGSNNFNGDLKITTGENESWDQALLAGIYTKFTDGEITNIPFFPFDIEFKPNNDKLNILKGDDHRKDFIAVFYEALTVKPKKAAFTFKGKEGSND